MYRKKRKNRKKDDREGFTLIELLAVIVILALLMAIAIPSVTRYITDSRKKTLISSIDSFIRAATNAVNDNDFGALTDEKKLYYIRVSDIKDDSCISLEKGGKDPFGNWENAYVVVHYNAKEYKYDFYFTFIDDAGFGMNLTKSDVLYHKGKQIVNPSPVTKTNIAEQTSAVIKRGGEPVQITTSDGEAIKKSNIYIISPVDDCRPKNVYIIADDVVNNPCTTNVSNLAQGTEYVHGDYTYRYGQEYNGSWHNIDGDGWGVRYTGPAVPRTIESDICTTVNNKPIISTSYMFYNLQTLEHVNLSNLDTSRVKNMSNMFGFCFNLNNPDLSHMNTSNVEDMNHMFHYIGKDVPNFTLDLSHFDTSNVKNMKWMFVSAGQQSNSVTINVSNWNTSKVTSMYEMFNGVASKATTFNLIGLDNWDTSNVENMTLMFAWVAPKAQRFDLNLSRWNVSKVNNMGQMFQATGKEANYWSVGNLSNWDTRNVTNMTNLFYEAGMNASTWNSIGHLKVYANNGKQMFYNVPNAKATLTLYKQPTYNYLYEKAFTGAATNTGSLITVNYSRNVLIIDNIINTRTPGANVVKGSQID